MLQSDVWIGLASFYPLCMLCSLNVRVGGCLYHAFVCSLCFLSVIYLPPQGRWLVGGALHQHGREWLHPQQLCGPSWLHTVWRVRSRISTFSSIFIKLSDSPLDSSFFYLLVPCLPASLLLSFWLNGKMVLLGKGNGEKQHIACVFTEHPVAISFFSSSSVTGTFFSLQLWQFY